MILSVAQAEIAFPFTNAQDSRTFSDCRSPEEFLRLIPLALPIPDSSHGRLSPNFFEVRPGVRPTIRRFSFFASDFLVAGLPSQSSGFFGSTAGLSRALHDVFDPPVFFLSIRLVFFLPHPSVAHSASPRMPTLFSSLMS